MKKTIMFLTALVVSIVGVTSANAVYVTGDSDSTTEYPSIGYDGSNVTVTKVGDVYQLKLTDDTQQDLIIRDGETVELDLAGHEFNNFCHGGNECSGFSSAAITILSGGKLTIKDTGGNGRVKLQPSSKVGGPSAIDNQGTLIIEDGKFEAQIKGTAAIYNSGELTFKSGTVKQNTDGAWGITNEGTATVKGGNFVQYRDYSIVLNKGTLEIDGGRFEAAGSVSHNALFSTVEGGTTTITDGSFKADEDGLLFFAGTAENPAGNTKISGGTYEGPEVPNDLLEEGYGYKDGKIVVYVTYKGVRYEVEKGQSWTTNTTLYNELLKANDFKNKHFVKFVKQSDGNQVTGGYNWTEPDTVYAVYTITVKFNGKDYTLQLGRDGALERIGNAVDASGNRLDTAMQNIDKDKYVAAHYYDANGKEYTSSTRVGENVVITETSYVISVKLNNLENNNIFSATAGDKASLYNLLKEWASKENFYYFVDSEGNKYNLESILEQNVELTAIFSVTVKVAPVDGVSIGVGYKVENGTTLRDILEASYGSGLQAYLDSEGFVKFVDANGNEVGLDDAITSDVDLVAVYQMAEVPENPNTFDGITSSIVMMIVSLVALVGGTIASKKSFNE